MPADDPASWPAGTWSAMPMPLEDVNDPQPRRIVPTESESGPAYQPVGPWPVIVVAPSLDSEDVNEPQPRRVVPTESAAAAESVSESRLARTRFPLKYLRQLFRQLGRGSGSRNLTPSVPETSQMTMSPQQVDAHQYSDYSHSRSQSQSSSRHYNQPTTSYDASQRSETHYPPLPASSYHPGTVSSSSSSSSRPRPGPERNHRHDSYPAPARSSYYRNRDRDRENRRDSGKYYERERDRDRDRDGEYPEGTGRAEELSPSSSPLQQPVFLFDIDEEQ
ncbi:hypothetical protein OG21DRAFT_1507704 [Imleria badia]|nr:hypothetical protein OG21DRAFT_1507704 [Imleria badia]